MNFNSVIDRALSEHLGSGLYDKKENGKFSLFIPVTNLGEIGSAPDQIEKTVVGNMARSYIEGRKDSPQQTLTFYTHRDNLRILERGNFVIIDLDFSLFSEEDYENYSVTEVDDFSTKYSFIKKETDSTQTALIDIIWNAAYNYPMWQVYLTLEDGQVYDFVYDNKYWAKNPYIADKENASLVKVDMYVDIQQVNGESFYSYSRNNEGEKLYHYYFPTDEEIELVYTVTDTSSKREITFSNLKQTVKFESGKNYKIDFKISDRFLNAIENWKVELIIKERN